MYFLLITIFGLLGFPQPNPQASREALEAKLAKSVSWESAELRAKSLTDPSLLSQPGKRGPFESADYHYIETAGAQRYYQTIYHQKDAPSQRAELFSDGKKAASVGYDKNEKQSNVFVFENPEAPFQKTLAPGAPGLMFGNLRQLRLKLTSAVALGKSRVLDRPCESYQFSEALRRKEAQNLVLVYDLDEETGLPLRIKSSSIDRGETVWEAMELDRADGYPFVRKSRIQTTRPDGSIASKSTTTITEIHFNRKHPESKFWPIIDPGAQVTDDSRLLRLAENIRGPLNSPKNDSPPKPAPLAKASNFPETQPSLALKNDDKKTQARSLISSTSTSTSASTPNPNPPASPNSHSNTSLWLAAQALAAGLGVLVLGLAWKHWKISK